ncbi:MAG TPA: MXAN_5187 C-terminal domain-containing protein [Pyrinomonadaceae bacterium]
MPIRDNKFARQAKQRNKKNVIVRDSQPTIDEQLKRLEEDIRRLKIEFDIYFNGASKRPPYDTKSRVETLIKRIADDRTLTFAQRYFYNSLVARFTSFRELWRRTMQGREEGREVMGTPRSTKRAEAKQQETRSNFVCADAHTDVETVRSLYDALVDAKARCGQPTDDLSFPRFHHLIATKTDKLKEHLGCERVRFSVSVEDGRVSFKAKADENDEG